jgi:hypothetical protein
MRVLGDARGDVPVGESSRAADILSATRSV